MVFDEDVQCLKGRLPPGFQPLSLLGQGGCATVVRATSMRFESEVALKVAHDGRGEFVKNERDRLYDLRGVPGIARMLESGESPMTYLACEIVYGPTLEAYLKQGNVPLTQALRLIARLADILAGVHDRGIVHRDLKPENALVKTRGQSPSLALIDFGLSVRLGRRSSILDRVSGTIAFMAPEAFDLQKLPGFTQDLYALGVILYQTCTGYLPYRGRSAIEVCGKHYNAPIPVLPPEYPARLNSLIAACLQKKVELRLGDARSFAHVLREAIEELGPLGDRCVPNAEFLTETAFDLNLQ